MRIGLFYDSFDPVNEGHLDTAALLINAFNLDQMVFVADPDEGTAGLNERIRMLDMAVHEYALLSVWHKGIDPSVFISDDLDEKIVFSFFPNDGRQHLEKAKTVYIPNEIPTSRNAMLLSGIIRELLYQGKPVSQYITLPVEEQLYRNGIYFPSGIRNIQRELMNHIDSKRYFHTCAVMQRAALLAEKYGVNAERARMASLLHDCAKSLNRMEAYNLSGDELFIPKVLHAGAGAVLAKEMYGVTDEEILRAIRLHCTGDRGMSELEMLVYLSDITEHTRVFPCVNELRAASEISLQLGMKKALEFSLKYLNSSGTENIHPATLRAYQYYKEV